MYMSGNIVHTLFYEDQIVNEVLISVFYLNILDVSKEGEPFTDTKSFF